MLAEQQTEWIISNNLINKGWHIDGDSKLKNVYFQNPPYLDQQKKLKGKKGERGCRRRRRGGRGTVGKKWEKNKNKSIKEYKQYLQVQGL